MAVIREILYRHLKGDSKRLIERSRGVSRTSINKYLKIASRHGYNSLTKIEQIDDIALKVADDIYKNSSRQGSSEKNISEYHSAIAAYLKDRYMTHTQIQRRLLAVYDFDIHIRALNRYIQKHFPDKPRATIHLTTVAGAEAQVDYGYVGLMKGTDGKVHKTYVFVMTLSHSRYRYVEFVRSQNQKSWCQSHLNAFAFFGAAPKRILLDNLKSGVINPHIYDPTINQAYEELGRFYNIILDPAKVRLPEHKGKVERSVLMVKQQLIAGCDYHNIHYANKAAINWCRGQISQRTCSSTGRTPQYLFDTEDKPNMLPLPDKTFDLPIWTEATVHKDHHISIQKNFYSVSTQYIGEEVNVRIGLRTIEIYHNHKLIKSHVRCFDTGQWITDEDDYPDSTRQFLHKTPEYCLEKAKEIGEYVFYFIAVILEKPSNTTLRKAQAVLRLLERYGAKRLDDACLRAATFDNYEYDTLVRILKKGLDEKNTGSCSTRVISIQSSAYAHPGDYYSSNMEVNYG